MWYSLKDKKTNKTLKLKIKTCKLSIKKKDRQSRQTVQTVLKVMKILKFGKAVSFGLKRRNMQLVIKKPAHVMGN